MNNIEQFLNNAARHYYAGDPIISDEQFDRLADSIGYNAVGAKQHENVAKHYNRLYSLQKFYEDEQKDTPLKGHKNIAHTVKLDGAAISILYIDGNLSQVLTRGDGVEGTIITDKFLATKLVPHTISIHGIVQVSGEIVAPMHVENSRNYASGSLSLKDVAEFSTRAVSFYAYSIYPFHTDSYTEDMLSLEREGFNTVFANDLQHIYECDGVVYRLDNNTEFLAEGFTSKFPKGAYALKERQEAVETELLGVEWNTAKTGRVTPVALLKPVYIGDKLVSRATLNNPGFIEAMDLRIGDIVAVRLAGMIIPEVCWKIGG